MRGRPVKLTPELQETIIQLLEVGAFLTVAAQYSGIHPDTLRDWCRRGEAEGERIYEAWESLGDEDAEFPEPDPNEAKYLEFSVRVARARGQVDARYLNVIALSANDSPEWAERMLKMRNPNWFREHVQVEQTTTFRDERTKIQDPKVFDAEDELWEAEEDARRAREGVESTDQAGGDGEPELAEPEAHPTPEPGVEGS